MSNEVENQVSKASKRGLGLTSILPCTKVSFKDIHTVVFNNTLLTLVMHDNTAYVPINPITSGIGVSYAGQVAKMQKKFEAYVVVLDLSSFSGMSKKAMCLSLDKLKYWLCGITNVSKLSETTKENLAIYQEECFETLSQAIVKVTSNSDLCSTSVVSNTLAAQSDNNVNDSLLQAINEMRNDNREFQAEVLKQLEFLTLQLSQLTGNQQCSISKFATTQGIGNLTDSEVCRLTWNCDLISSNRHIKVTTVYDSAQGFTSAYDINVLIEGFGLVFPKFRIDNRLTR